MLLLLATALTLLALLSSFYNTHPTAFDALSSLSHLKKLTQAGALPSLASLSLRLLPRSPVRLLFLPRAFLLSLSYVINLFLNAISSLSPQHTLPHLASFFRTLRSPPPRPSHHASPLSASSRFVWARISRSCSTPSTVLHQSNPQMPPLSGWPPPLPAQSSGDRTPARLGTESQRIHLPRQPSQPIPPPSSPSPLLPPLRLC